MNHQNGALTVVGMATHRDSDYHERHDPLTFTELRVANIERSVALDGFRQHPAARSLSSWTNKLAEELGEIARLVDRIENGRSSDIAALNGEIADVIIVAFCLAEKIGADPGAIVRAKFNEKSEQIGCRVRLPEPAR